MRECLKRTWALMAVLMIVLAVLAMPLLALAQVAAAVASPAVTPAASVSLLATIVSFLPILLAMAGPYVTHILQGYTQKIPAAWQPMLSAFSGIVIAVLTGSATGSTLSPDVLALVGGISGGAGHGLLQSTPIAAPVVIPKV